MLRNDLPQKSIFFKLVDPDDNYRVQITGKMLCQHAFLQE